jgi:hypothetical protein
MMTRKHSPLALGLTLLASLCSAGTGCSSDMKPGEVGEELGFNESSLNAPEERFEREEDGQGDNDAEGGIAAAMVHHPSGNPVFVTAARRVDNFLGVSAFYSGQAALAPDEYTSITAVGPDVDIAPVGMEPRVVVAVTNATGKLTLIQYKVDAGNNQRQLSRMFSFETGVQTNASRKVEIASVRWQSGPIVMTSVINESGNLQLNTWKVSDAAIEPLDVETAGSITDVVLAGDADNETAATATFNSAGEVRLILWSTDWAGNITRKLDGFRDIGSAAQVAISLQSNRLSVAQRTSSNLLLKAYDASFLGSGSIQPVDTHTLSATSRVAIDDHAGRMIVALRTLSGNLKLIAFERANGVLTRITDNELDNAPAGSVTLFDLVSSDEILFTGSNGNASLDVKGIVWRYFHY